MEHLILFARRPELGRVKTRLTPPATAAQALALYEAFLADQLRFAASLATAGRSVEACFDGPWAGVPAIVATEQGPGDLGERMARALARSRSRGARATVIIGTDAPSLPAGRVLGAFEALASGADAVIVPAEDGGYVLVGAPAPHPALFEGIPWGGSDVAEVTRRRAAEAGLRLAELEGWRDVDTWDDLAALARDLEADADRAPATARVLSFLLDVPQGPVV